MKLGNRIPRDPAEERRSPGHGPGRRNDHEDFEPLYGLTEILSDSAWDAPDLRCGSGCSEAMIRGAQQGTKRFMACSITQNGPELCRGSIRTVRYFNSGQESSKKGIEARVKSISDDLWHFPTVPQNQREIANFCIELVSSCFTMKLIELNCPNFGSEKIKELYRYETTQNGVRVVYDCAVCFKSFSETKGTFMEGLVTPISKIALVLKFN